MSRRSRRSTPRLGSRWCACRSALSNRFRTTRTTASGSAVICAGDQHLSVAERPRSGRRRATSAATSSDSSIGTAAEACIDRERVRSQIPGELFEAGRPRSTSPRRPSSTPRDRVRQADLELCADRRQRAAQLVRRGRGEQLLTARRLFQPVEHPVRASDPSWRSRRRWSRLTRPDRSAASMRSTSARIASTGANARATTPRDQPRRKRNQQGEADEQRVRR